MVFVKTLRSFGLFRTTTKAMKHYLKGYLKDTSPDFIILQHGKNDLKSDDPSKHVLTDIVNLGLLVRNLRNTVYISDMIIIHNKLNEKTKKSY